MRERERENWLKNEIHSHFALIGVNALGMRNQQRDDASKHAYKWCTIDARMRLILLISFFFSLKYHFLFHTKTS